MRPTLTIPAARDQNEDFGGELRAEKIHAWHRERLAVVYVRQSTGQQVRTHRDSGRLQYGLRARAQALGWAAVSGNSTALLTEAIEIRAQRIVGEVLFPQAWGEELHLKGGMSIDALEDIDEIDVGIDAL